MKKFLKRLDNFWYHYKWPVIIFTGFAVVLIIMTTQFFSRAEYDVSVLYAGPLDITPNQSRDAETEIAKLLENDQNGDGKKNCQITPFFLLTEEQAAALQAEYDAMDELYFVDRAKLAANQQKFTNQISAGEGSLLLLDPHWYDLLRKQDLIVPLSEVEGIGGTGLEKLSPDGYSYKLSDTPFAGYFTAIGVFPDDTVVCLRRMSAASAFIGKSEAETQLALAKNILIAMLSFGGQ